MRARTVAFLVALLALACAPELDWRDLGSIEGGFAALMPAKPRYEVRSLVGATDIAILGERNAVAAADIELFLSSFQPLTRKSAN